MGYHVLIHHSYIITLHVVIGIWSTGTANPELIKK
jgi:hypothetical protein